MASAAARSHRPRTAARRSRAARRRRRSPPALRRRRRPAADDRSSADPRDVIAPIRRYPRAMHVPRHVIHLVTVAVSLALLTGAAVVGWAWKTSLLPDSYDVTSYGYHDYGGGAVPAEAAAHGLHHAHVGTSVARLHGPTGVPDVRFRLVAQRTTIRLASGQKVEALTFDGRAPGPELRVRQGDLVEVTLVNRDVEPGVTIHWHGVDLPNAEDGVAGVTQDAVPPGGSYVYRFRINEPGTYWYHSH